MSNNIGNGNEEQEMFWTPEHGHARDSGSAPNASTNFFHSGSVDSSPIQGINYGPHQATGEKFTVLSDGLGNFIKVYHQPTDDVSVPGKFEYDLFSGNNSFVRPAPGFGYLFHQQQSQSSSSPQMPINAQQTHQRNTATENPASNTSMLINQLVGNWAPTISGTYSPFGSGGPSLLTEGLPRSSEVYFQPTMQQHQQHQVAQPPPQQITPQPQQPSPTHHIVDSSIAEGSPKVGDHNQAQSQASQMSTASIPPTSGTSNYNQQLNDDNSAKLNQSVNKKQRIVAEVKPMRMSYSDVLSKNVAPSSVGSSSTQFPSSANGASAANATGTGATLKSGTPNYAYGNNGYASSSGKVNKSDKGQGRKTLQGGAEEKYVKKPDRLNVGSGQRKPAFTGNSSLAGNGQAFSENKQTSTVNGADKSSKKFDKPTNKLPKNRSSNETVGLSGKKSRIARNYSDAYTVQDVQNSAAKEVSQDGTEEECIDDDDASEDEYDENNQQQPQPFMYNVKKNNSSSDTHIEKISSSRYKRSNRSTGVTRAKVEKSYQQPSNSNAKRGQRPRKNQKYVFFLKVLNIWYEYAIFVLLWLWSLVSDVTYLSLRLCWDYVVAGYQYCQQHFVNLKQDLQQNRPGAWLKNIWNSFDSRFAVDSTWAFWRRKSKAATSTEEQRSAGKNYYKDGRLPSTADEAMSSLLNCKGKDAYSILGVNPDCSQEQIRKHYKKIAVLVHPDKNKQPGAEEAFKVLQRSFELIGEPENRKSYDQSLAEALNAEKAWSEINDLLTQLHTKISEAANTIRCSSCCLRHPRKPTGRPHYAARECNSCKIRHPAREGDIWAETSFFGLRWKYLAMMEGNVYDITEWANCQKGALSHLQPNSHIVQYRIVLGGNSQQQQQQQQQQGNQQQNEKDSARTRKEAPQSEPNLDDFLNNIYGGQNQQSQQSQGGTRRRHRRN